MHRDLRSGLEPAILPPKEFPMQIAIVTFDGFNELDSFIAAGILNRMTAKGWKAHITSPAPRVTSMNGVTIVDPSSTYIGQEVRIEPDVTIQPMTVIEGSTRISAGAQLGPNAWIKDSTIGKGCRVFMSHIDQATMDDESRCGPFSNLRPGTRLGNKVKVGNFVEIKNSQIGDKTAISHLTYIGDATVGSETNIGAGTITCNYDGYSKNKTEIGSGTFVGSNSTLIAPVKIGDGAFIAAGSVVTHDVPDDAMAVGRARQENKEGWAASWRERQSARRS